MELCEAGGLFDHIILAFLVKPISFLLNFIANTICIALFCTSFIYRLGDSTIEHDVTNTWFLLRMMHMNGSPPHRGG
ncbi:hypothetical protein HanPI659440_Chr08g0284781 [Helianthus annuus]|nr:hypothetical protein HanPI659440_Chr08g0284781 [Helianthus annuus]